MPSSGQFDRWDKCRFSLFVGLSLTVNRAWCFSRRYFDPWSEHPCWQPFSLSWSEKQAGRDYENQVMGSSSKYWGTQRYKAYFKSRFWALTRIWRIDVVRSKGLCFIECIYLQALINIKLIYHKQRLIIPNKGQKHILSDNFKNKLQYIQCVSFKRKISNS